MKFWCQVKMNGCRDRPQLQMQQFKVVIEELELYKFKGPGTFFSCNNWQKGTALTWCRLDRVFVTASVQTLNFSLNVKTMGLSTSDHCALLATFKQVDTSQCDGKRKIQQTKLWWFKDQHCLKIVRHSWCNDDPSLAYFKDQLMKLKHNLLSWGAVNELR